MYQARNSQKKERKNSFLLKYCSYCLTAKWMAQTGKQVKFELEVVALDALDSIGIRRKRQNGDSWAYKQIIEQVLATTGVGQSSAKEPVADIVQSLQTTVWISTAADEHAHWCFLIPEGSILPFRILHFSLLNPQIVQSEDAECFTKKSCAALFTLHFFFCLRSNRSKVSSPDRTRPQQ